MYGICHLDHTEGCYWTNDANNEEKDYRVPNIIFTEQFSCILSWCILSNKIISWYKADWEEDGCKWCPKMFGDFCLNQNDWCYKVCQYHQSQNSNGQEMKITGKQGNYKSATNDMKYVKDCSCYFVAYWGLFWNYEKILLLKGFSLSFTIPCTWFLLPADSK